MRHPAPSFDLLICQPAVLVPEQLELALGIQNLWCHELMNLGVDCHPTVYSRPDPRDPSRNQPMFHRTPYALRGFHDNEALGLPSQSPDMVLQSQLVLATDPHCEGRARVGRPRTDQHLVEAHAVGGIRVLLRWVCEVIDKVAVQAGRAAPAHTWQRLLRTKNPHAAAETLTERGFAVRRGLGLLAPVIEDRVADAEHRASLN